MKFVTYTGSQKSHTINDPFVLTFLKHVPQAVHPVVLERLSSDLFEEWVPGQHAKAPDKPFLMKCPQTLAGTLALRASITRLLERYPTASLTALLVKRPLMDLFEAFPMDRVSAIDSYDVRPFQWLREFDAKYQKTDAPFGVASLAQTSLEFAYLTHFDIRAFEEPWDKPKRITQIPHESERTHLTIIASGETLGSTYGLASSFTSLTEFAGLPVQVLTSKASMKEVLEKLRHSKYVISMGDSQWNILAVYLNVPMFCFIADTASIHLYQLTMINASSPGFVNYSPQVHREPSAILGKLEPFVHSLLNPGTPSPVTEEPPVREVIKINVPSTPMPKVKTLPRGRKNASTGN